MTGTFLVLISTFFWALDTLIRYPLINAGLDPVQIVFLEHILLVLGVSIWLKARGQSLWIFAKRDWLALVVIGGLGSAVATLTFTMAFSYMNPTLVILLQKLQPVVAISLAAIVLKEKITIGYAACVVLALSGSFLLIYDDISALLLSQGWHYSAELVQRLLGYGFTLIAVVSWGASTVFGKKLGLSGYSSDQIMQGRFVVGLLVMLPFMFLSAPYEQSISALVIGKVAVMVLISGAIGMLLYYQGLKRIDSKHSALAEMGFPVMAGIINWVVLDLTLTPLQIAGAVLLLLASFSVHIDLGTLFRKITKRQSYAS